MPRRVGDQRLLPANGQSLKKAIKEAKGGGQLVEYRIEGARGLVMLITPVGTATWYVHYDMVEGTKRLRRKMKLGRVDEIPLGTAIDRALALRPAIKDGGDPAREVAVAKERLTFAQLAERRFAKQRLRPSTVGDQQLVMRRDILPVIGHLFIDGDGGVTSQHVIDIVDTIEARGASRRADTARALISAIYEYGKSEKLLITNPAADMRRRHDYAPRDVVATNDQLRVLWNAAHDGTAAMDDTIADIVMLATLTGQRRKETAHLFVTDVHLDTDMPRMEFRRSDTKNAHKHVVPLSRQARLVVERALKRRSTSRWLFPGQLPNRPISVRSVTKAMERTRDRLKVDDITIHDLRRTMGTYLSKFGVPESVRKRIFNHDGKRTGNVTADVYDWYDHFEEKRAALELWGDAVDVIVSGVDREIDRYEVRLARYKGTETLRVLSR
jgi:integrase